MSSPYCWSLHGECGLLAQDAANVSWPSRLGLGPLFNKNLLSIDLISEPRATWAMAVITHDFVGRRSELRVLEQRYASPRSEMVPVYGRRRVGKTELLLRFASGKPTVLFIA